MAGKIEVPVKYWYTMQELMQRWNVPESEIIHSMECYGLRPSFRARFTCELYHRTDTATFTPISMDADRDVVWTDIFTVWAVTRQFMNELITVGSVDLAEKMLYHGNMPDVMYSPNVSAIVRYAGILFTREEIARFEERHGRSSDYAADSPTPGEDEKVPTKESDVQLVDRLKREEISDKEIAQELKRAFPGIYPSRIGKLVTGAPNDNITTDAYRKRGSALLK